MERAGHMLSEWLGTQFEWSNRDREVAAFSFALLLSSGFFLALLFFLSAVVGVVPEAIAMACTSGGLRTFAGGAHLATGWRCGIFSASLATLVAAVAHALGPFALAIHPGVAPWISVVVGAFVAGVMWKFAPADVPEKPVTSPQQRRRLRNVSTAFPLLWAAASTLLFSLAPTGASAATLCGLWIASTVGLLWETFSVIPPGTHSVQWLDTRIEQILHSHKGGVAQ